MSNICFFSSVGDNLTLIYDIKQNYSNYNIICNYYGNNIKIFNEIKNIAIYSENNINTCKFPAIKKMYNYVKQYDYVFIYDDDAIITNGSLNNLIAIIEKYSLDVISPAHNPQGKISHKLHLPQKNNYIFRYVNFIEMNFPMFSKTALKKFMLFYNDNLKDWGIDHLYSHIYNNNMAIVDTVTILNPKNNIINNVDREQKRLEWKKFQLLYNIKEIIPKTIKFI